MTRAIIPARETNRRARSSAISPLPAIARVASSWSSAVRVRNRKREGRCGTGTERQHGRPLPRQSSAYGAILSRALWDQRFRNPRPHSHLDAGTLDAKTKPPGRHLCHRSPILAV